MGAHGRPTHDFAGLVGVTAIVTGAGAESPSRPYGVGQAIALALADAGAAVVIVDQNAEAGAVTAGMIVAGGGRAEVVHGSVADPVTGSHAIAAAGSIGSARIVLVNCVGLFGPVGGVLVTDLEQWEAVVDVNITSTVRMTRACVPAMMEIGSGSVVIIGSMAGLGGGHPNLSYATSKGAIPNLTRTLAAELGPHGIRVNAIAPGLLYTPMAARAGLTAADREVRANTSPLKVEGTADDVAALTRFLSSDDARLITGVTIAVDGGISATLPMGQILEPRKRPSESGA